MEFEQLEQGRVSLVMQDENNVIKQIGLTPAQIEFLQSFVAAMSKEKKLVIMPKDYDLTLKANLCNKCKNK